MRSTQTIKEPYWTRLTTMNSQVTLGERLFASIMLNAAPQIPESHNQLD